METLRRTIKRLTQTRGASKSRSRSKTGYRWVISHLSTDFTSIELFLIQIRKYVADKVIFVSAKLGKRVRIYVKDVDSDVRVLLEQTNVEVIVTDCLVEEYSVVDGRKIHRYEDISLSPQIELPFIWFLGGTVTLLTQIAANLIVHSVIQLNVNWLFMLLGLLLQILMFAIYMTNQQSPIPIQSNY